MADPADGAMWQSRARSFGSVAAAYAELRPGYPADAVEFLAGDRPLRVLDLGAGTGRLSEVLARLGHQVTAVDPSVEMLGQLRARLPSVRVLVGSAEGVPLPDGSVDAVVAGQAAHWFDPPRAAAEMRRLLRPGGVVGLVWNARDRRVPWVAALEELISDEARDHDADRRVVERFADELPAAVTRRGSTIVQSVNPEQLVAGIGTRSYVAVMDAAARTAFLDRVRHLLAEHPGTRGRDVLDLPYVTTAYRLALSG